MIFDWDKNKAIANLIKHGISFEEAKTVFFDDYARVLDDDLHSIIEKRELIFGYSNKNRLLIISFVERNNNIRIINARKVTKKEREIYEEYYK
ncbi:MAG TPA: BrnT family toxin [Candidatus Kapabacteria bacterium]|nr:BrnT family toxin [Candidatus Kapabacteria bacterium]